MLASGADGAMEILECDGNVSFGPGSKVVISSTCSSATAARQPCVMH